MTTDFQTLNNEVSRIQALAPLTINSDNPIPGNTLKENDLDLQTLVPNAEYKFFHKNIDNDESVDVDVFITLNDFTVVAKREIDVVGITAHKDEQIEEENKKIKALQDEVTRIERLSPLDFATDDLYLEKNFFDASKLQLGTLIKDAEYTFQNAPIDHDGKYIVFITISYKQGNFAIFNNALIQVNVTGIDAAIVKDKLDKEVKRINELPELEIKIVGVVLPNSLKASDIQLDPKLSAENYEITNELIDTNREYEVNIKITLDGQEQEAKRKIKVTFRKWDHMDNLPPISWLKGGLSNGFFLKDSNGNIWILCSESKLWVSKNDGQTFTEMKDGASEYVSKYSDATIFEDSNHTLWIITNATDKSGYSEIKKGILYSKDGGKNWEHNDYYIKDAKYGSIYEDTRNNLYIMADGKLIISRDKGINWQESTAIVGRGTYGTIFEDSSGKIWILGQETKLQYSSDFGKNWQEANIEIQDTSHYGAYSNIFEDSQHNLWVMGLNIPLQVLRNGSSTWKTVNSGINATNGKIIEDSNGTLWAMSDDSQLKFSKDGGTTWENSNSGISNFNDGIIFKDSKGFLWAMGDNNKLLISKDGGNSWLDTKSGITEGSGLRIFEDNDGVIWILCQEGLYKLEK